MAAPVTDAEWLAWIGKLLQNQAAPHLDATPVERDGFYCLLDEQPTQLVPQRLLRQPLEDASGGELFINPRCRLSALDCGLTGFPGSDNFRATESGGPSIGWVEDPATGSWMPFWLGAALTGTVDELRRDPAAIPALPRNELRNLRLAGIVVSEDYVEARRKHWAEVAERCRSTRTARSET